MKMKTAITFAVGVFAGIALCGPAAQASSAITAVLSDQPIYVNGQLVAMTAYSIGGNNYVKLRDIGKAVDLAVDYDGSTNSVHINTALPYQEEVTLPAQPIQTPPAPVPGDGYTITADHWSREDFSQQADPAVFTGVYDRALYNTIRQTLVDGGPGTAPAYTMVAKGDDYSAVRKLLGRMDNTSWLEHYVPENFTNYYEYLDYFAVSINALEQYQEARDYIRPIISQAAQLGSDREKVEHLHDYLCSLLTYDANATADIAKVFSPHSGELKGACGAYARALNFLCGEAGIPSFSVVSATHSWNMVCADGHWLYVDASANDLHGNKNALLVGSYPRHTDIAPEATAFLKELLVPGSTK